MPPVVDLEEAKEHAEKAFKYGIIVGFCACALLLLILKMAGCKWLT